MSSTITVHMRTTLKHQGRTYSVGREYAIDQETAAQWSQAGQAFVLRGGQPKFDIERAVDPPVCETPTGPAGDEPEPKPEPAKRKRLPVRRRRTVGREVGGAMSADRVPSGCGTPAV
jgi:hypothetical protein